MSKKSQEILYDSEPENVETNEVVQTEAVQIPQDIPIVAPIPIRPIRAPKSKIALEPVAKTETFKCAYCDKQFVRNYYLNRHIEDGRCPVIRNINKAKEKQLKDLEVKINQKLHKKDLREEKKQMKALTTVVKETPVKAVKPRAVKPVQSAQPVQPVQQPVQQPRQRSGFIINF
jgi:hypothetical protein